MTECYGHLLFKTGLCERFEEFCFVLPVIVSSVSPSVTCIRRATGAGTAVEARTKTAAMAASTSP